MYKVQVVASVLGDEAADRRVRAAVKRAGGVVEEMAGNEEAGGAVTQVVIVRMTTTQMLRSVVSSIEGLRGVAVVAVGKPERVADHS